LQFLRSNYSKKFKALVQFELPIFCIHVEPNIQFERWLTWFKRGWK